MATAPTGPAESCPTSCKSGVRWLKTTPPLMWMSPQRNLLPCHSRNGCAQQSAVALLTVSIYSPGLANCACSCWMRMCSLCTARYFTGAAVEKSVRTCAEPPVNLQRQRLWLVNQLFQCVSVNTVGCVHAMCVCCHAGYGSAGGVAYVGVWGNTYNGGHYYQPAFVFPAQLGNGYPKYVVGGRLQRCRPKCRCLSLFGVSYRDLTHCCGHYDEAMDPSQVENLICCKCCCCC